MLNTEQAAGLLNKLTAWYFNNNIDKTIRRDALPFQKESQNRPNYSSDMWAKLMTDALVAFSEGLDDQIEPDNRRASYEAAVELVGSEAFNTIAYLISAAGTQLPLSKIAIVCPKCGGYGHSGEYGFGGGVYHQPEALEGKVTPSHAKGLPKPLKEKYQEESLFEKEEEEVPLVSPDPTEESGHHAVCTECGGEGFIEELSPEMEEELQEAGIQPGAGKPRKELPIHEMQELKDIERSLSRE
jgi:hypothetical protein